MSQSENKLVILKTLKNFAELIISKFEAYATKSATKNYVRRITATENSVTFLDGNENELCRIIFEGKVTVSGSALNELDTADMNAVFDNDPQPTLTGGTTDITDSELGPVFNGDNNVTVDGGEDISADDINNLFN